MVEIRFVSADEMLDYRDAISFGFGQDPEGWSPPVSNQGSSQGSDQVSAPGSTEASSTDTRSDDRSDDDAERDRWLALNPVETSIAAFDRGRMVATFGSYAFDLMLPGGATAPMAGTTHVTVHPTHRRRGILTEMMRLSLDQAVELGQPMAGLWASEERIYGRFGYGPAAFGYDLTIPARTVELAGPQPELSVHPLTVDEARAVLPPIYARQRAAAGGLVRTEAWWDARWFYRQSSSGGGWSGPRYVIVERDGRPVGYVVFRLQTPQDFSEGTIGIMELVADDDSARRVLWNFATNVDLFRNVRWHNAPLDDPVLIEADRFRAIERSVLDSIWIRPLDVAALLSTRGYDRDGVVVLGISDRFGPAGGRYRLEAVGGVGNCEPTDAPAEVELAVEGLGRLVLGGGSALGLHRAGLLDGDQRKAMILDDLLNTRRQPHCPEVF